MKKQNLVLGVLFSLCMLNSAYAELSVLGGASIGVGGAQSGTSLGIPGSIKQTTGYGFGAVYNHQALELGVLYVSRKGSATISGTFMGQAVSGGSNFSQGSVHIPVDYRLGAGAPLSLAVGLYYDTKEVLSTNSDYGITVGPRLMLGHALFVDALFNYGLKSQDLGFDSPASYHSKEMLVMLGYKFH